MMQIVFDTIIYSLQKSGGISRMYNEIIPRIVMFGNDVSIEYLVTKKPIQYLPFFDNSCSKKVTIHNVTVGEKCFRPRRLWHKTYPRIKEIAGLISLGDTRKKIWHSTYYTDLMGWRGKKIVTVHDMIYERYQDIFFEQDNQELREMKRKTVFNSDVVVCVSNTTKQDLLEQFSGLNKKINVIYHGASDFFSYIEKEKIPEQYRIDFPFILYVGRRDRHKNFLELLKAYSQWKANKEIKLLVVGQKWQENEIRIIGELKVQNKVILLEGINDVQLLYLYNQANTFVYPSLFEGFGIPLLESMACGCPIVASRIPTTIEIAKDIPFYYTIGNIDELLRALSRGADCKKQDDRILSGFDRIKDFSWDKSAQQFYEVYQSLY